MSQLADDFHAQWVLRRACRLGPAQLAFGCLLPGLVALALGLGFACLGYPWMAAFALAQLIVLVLAFLQHGRHVGDCEVITLEPGQVRVQSTDGSRCSELVLPLSWLRVERCEGGAGLIELRCSRRCVCVGRHLPPAERARFHQELRASLQAPGAF